MFRRLISHITHISLISLIPPILLVAVGIVIAAANYTPGTWLSGWDSLHPELNWGMYIQRIFWGVWQEHQGLGAMAVQAQASELARLWYLLPAVAILPANLVRYGYFFLTLILGPLGVYFLLNKLILKDKVANSLALQASFLGGLFYLLNLGTMQNFYLPLEMFATAYGFLPWLFLAAGKYALDGGKKSLVLLSIAFLFFAPAAHTPTLWLASFAGLILFVAVLQWRRAVIVLLTGLVVNGFWLLPSAFQIVSAGGGVVASHISQQFTPRAVAVSREFGGITDLALIKGYLFDWGHFDFGRGDFADLMAIWKGHLGNPAVLLIGFGAFFLAIVGIIKALKQKSRLVLCFLPVFVFAFVAMGDFLPMPAGVVSEALRFPFTKFSFLLILCLAVFFGLGVSWVIRFACRLLSTAYCLSRFVVVSGQLAVVFLLSIALIAFSWPAFQGNLICSCVRVKIPGEYLQMFNWFGQQDRSGRIAPFPVDSIYGWAQYSWGYEGAGFRWFGLPQPILDREFDRWNGANENYYWEMSNALYSKNLALFESVLEKYQVRYLLVDENIISPVSPKSLYFEELEQLAGQSRRISLITEFGAIKVYGFDSGLPVSNFVSLANNLPVVEPQYQWGDRDQPFASLGHYVSNLNNLGQSRFFPFRSLFTGRGPLGKEFTLREEAGDFVLEKEIPGFLRAQELVIPREEGGAGAGPEVVASDGRITAKIAKVPVTGNLRKDEKGNFAMELPQLPHDRAYLISVSAQNVSGQPFLFWVENLNSRRADLEAYLPSSDKEESFFSKERFFYSYFIQPPMEIDGLGYTLHIDNTAFGKEKPVNSLLQVEVYEFPYSFLSDLYFPPSQDRISWATSFLRQFEVSHPGQGYFRVDITPNAISKDTVLMLYQSYSSGWLAIAIDGNQRISWVTDHKLIDNWANGWELTGTERIVYLFFWPQILEWGGLGILGLCFGGLSLWFLFPKYSQHS